MLGMKFVFLELYIIFTFLSVINAILLIVGKELKFSYKL